jgi:hypothetical protein
VTRGFMGPLGGFWPKTRQEACDRLETTVMRPSGTRENKQTNKSSDHVVIKFPVGILCKYYSHMAIQASLLLLVVNLLT